MSTTHTEEPWKPYNGWTEAVALSPADYNRAKACVDALAGVDNPAEWVERVKKYIEATQYWQLDPHDQKERKCHLGIILPPTQP